MSRGTKIFVAGVVAIGALVVTAYFLILRPSQLPPPEKVPETPVADLGTPQKLPTFTQIEGPVQIRVQSDKWEPAILGGEIAKGAAVRTRAGGRAAVEYGSSIKLDIRADTEVRVDRFDEKVAKFVMGKGGGLVIVDVGEDNKRKVQVGAEGSDALAETIDGRMHVMSDGKGRVQAAVTRGDATLSAHGKSVQLTAGKQSRVEPGRAPSAPSKIPKSLLLKVKWPKKTTAKRRHLITGRASPGARVRVGKRLLTADKSGRFQAMVELREGKNAVKIHAVDILGREKTGESPAIIVDTKAPSHAVETNPDMWKRRR